MGQVAITVNGRTYRLRCGEGDEARLLAMAAHVTSKVDQLVAEFGQAGDDRLMLMAALLVCDEMFDARDQLAAAAALHGSSAEPVAAAGPTEAAPRRRSGGGA